MYVCVCVYSCIQLVVLSFSLPLKTCCVEYASLKLYHAREREKEEGRTLGKHPCDPSLMHAIERRRYGDFNRVKQLCRRRDAFEISLKFASHILGCVVKAVYY